MTRLLPLALVASSIAAQGCSRCAGDPPPPALDPGVRRPNVLIVLWDTARADRMSLYGHPRATTPRLDSLAGEAAVFDRAISPGMWTVPSHASIFTALPVASHGANARWIWLDGRFHTLAEHFADAGYETWAWSANPYLSDASNLLQGFQTVTTSWDGPWADAAGRATMAKRIDRDASVELGPAWAGSRGRGWPPHLTAYKDSVDVASEALLDWVDHRADPRPWVAYVNLLEAHHPRVPSLGSRERLLEPELLEAGLATDASLFRTMSAMEGRASFTEAELDAMRGVYDAAISDLDRGTGALVDALRDRGMLDDTVVVIVSDHGEHLGEHGMFDHRWSVWQELLHVPLVIRYPARAPAGHRADPVSTQQLFPTLCALTDVPCPAGLPVDSLFAAPPPRVYAELIQPTPRLPQVQSAYGDLDPERWRRRYQVGIEGQYKLVRVSDMQHRLYDLGADPGEAHDLSATDPDRTRVMLDAVRAWRDGVEPYDPKARAPSDHPSPALKASPGTREQLEQLGYVAPEE